MTLGFGDGLYGDGQYGRPAPINLESAPVITVVPPGEATSPLTGNRLTKYRFDLLDTNRRKFGELDGVSDGSISWQANSQVKGGGKITVAKSDDLHSSSIRVVSNLPVVDQVDFEEDADIFGVYGGEGYSDPTSVIRDTATFHEGGSSLQVEWAAQAGSQGQGVRRTFSGLTEGQTYTIVSRVLHTAGDSAYAEIIFGGASVSVPIKPDWSTVTLTFVATSDAASFGLKNSDPTAGTSTNLDQVILYEGEADGYNGETFSYSKFNWGHVRIRPVALVEGMTERSLGVFVATAPTIDWGSSGGRESIELLDRTSVLSQDYLTQSYAVAKGANVIAAIKRLIRSTGEQAGSIPDEGEVLPNTLTWGPGKNKLTVINEILDAVGYFALWSDSNGDYRVEKYSSPSDRPVEYEFLDDSRGIYLPGITVDNDIYGTPNRVVMTSQGDGQEEGWVAVASNTNPDSPLSFQARGRWITTTQLGVEAASPQDLQDKADRSLAALITKHSTLDLNHGPVPGLRVNNVVRFRRQAAGLDGLYTLTSTEVNFNPMELAKSTLTEIINL